MNQILHNKTLQGAIRDLKIFLKKLEMFIPVYSQKRKHQTPLSCHQLR